MPEESLVFQADRLKCFAASAPGEVVGSVGSRAWVRSQDALLCCNFRVALQQGEILASRGAAGTSSIPLDFDGDAWLPGKRVAEEPFVKGKRQAQLPKPHRKVPIFRHDFEPGFVESFTSKCREILCSGRPLSENYYVRQFEESFAQLSHVPFALATTSGTQALAIALRALDVAGKAVVIPSNTFFATQVAALNAGANLEWVDIEKEYMQVCPRSLEAVLHRHQHGRVGAVILVHIAGIISPNFAQIRRLCQTYGAPLVEDAAHAHLAYGSEHAGAIGEVAAFSFFPTKVMTAGEAGMITTSNEALFKKMQSIKEFGKDIEGPRSRLVQVLANATNGRISEFTGLLGLLECGRVKERIQRRNALLERFVQKLKKTHYRVITQPEGQSSAYKCVVVLEGHLRQRREELRTYALERGVTFTAEVYFRPVHRMPAHAEDGLPVHLPVTDEMCENHVCPPLYPELTFDDVDYTCSVMNDFAELPEAKRQKM
ncbi:unnamed protein product [Durusdinium trenchii]|uniref:Uncharacterized protein n=1 Tax=Durusdinium trenchii TaxID=1381693 RepID=A0ABP0NN04_9DINO